MKTIAAVGCTPAELEIACFGMLLAETKLNNTKVHIIIISKKWNSGQINSARLSVAKIGAEIHIIREFDYSSISQDNVNSLRSVIESINPSLIIIPNIKSKSKSNEIAGMSSLLAGRSVENVIMFDADLHNNNSQFSPNVYFRLDGTLAKAKIACASNYDDHIRNFSSRKSLKKLHNFFSKKANMNNNLPTEGFQSHRILLGQEDDLWA